jgi:hypothetical protein
MFIHFSFSIIYGIILPIDELIFFKMVKTTNQMGVPWVLPSKYGFTWVNIKT